MALALALLELEQENEVRRHQNLRRYRQALRNDEMWRSFPDVEFRSHFRISRISFERLCAELIPFLHQPRLQSSVPLHIKILTAITFYAHGSYQRSIGVYYVLGLAQPTVSVYLSEVTEAFNTPEFFRRYICFPNNDQERQRVQHGFYEKFRFPGILGCIDGTHVTIITPREDEHVFFSRKMDHSLNVMIICDSDLKILEVDASFGGASHDSHVWGMSEIQQSLRYLHEHGHTGYLLGDSGYGQTPWLMVPILNAIHGSPEEHYTKRHCSVRNCVERCIGVLKNRWRCLLSYRTLHYAPRTAGRIVNACCVLHNFAIMQGEEIRLPNINHGQQNHGATQDFEAEEIEDIENPNTRAAGIITRQALVQRLNQQQ